MHTITAQFIAGAFSCEFRELVPAAIDRALGHARGYPRFVWFFAYDTGPIGILFVKQ
jgi:hypothetical protein